MAKLLVLLFPLLLFNVFPSAPAKADSCSYGCCDCGCVSSRLQKNAPYIARIIQGRLSNGGRVKSFSVEVDKEKAPTKKWVCTPTENGADCENK
jgi:hypothetical protein